MEDEKSGFVTEDHLKYLDELKESNIVNMFGAYPYLQENFDLNKEQAIECLYYWMRTFSKRHANKKTT